MGDMSCLSHYLNQMYGLPGALTDESYGPNGPWPAGGAKKPADLRELLYDGTTAEDKGRKGYLRARKTLPPQEKAESSVTAAQDVGWTWSTGKPSRGCPPIRQAAAVGPVPF